MNRRLFISGGLAAAHALAAKRFEYSRIAVLTDEVAESPAEAIAFARQYRLRYVELRSRPGDRRSYFRLSEDELHQTARELKEAGLEVTFLNSSLCKYTLPGTDPVRRRSGETDEQRAQRLANEARRFDARFEELAQVVRAARILGARHARVFAFNRVAEPEALFPRIAGIITELAQLAEKEGVRLLLENEGSCNVATSAECAAMLKLLPESIGLNWDPHNEYSPEAKIFPEGYALLPKKRLRNVQVKARSIVPEYKQWIDWAGIFTALSKDGFEGYVGLETHVQRDQLIEAAHKSMRELQRILS
ncbi:MAG: sugar phosphate isomerase/epimerase family protein [Bryobacteraceae bacterium]|nr:sugar phosphate isomerase/epimerase family protein [Bryobacteraceae bacterium]